jgi:hypothetical protein
MNRREFLSLTPLLVLFSIKPRNNETKQLLDKLKLGAHQVPGYIRVSDTEKYKYWIHANSGELRFRPVKEIPST